MLRSKDTRYEDVLRLDSTIRDFPFPPEFLQEFSATGESEEDNSSPKPFRVEILRFLAITCMHTTLLRLHRYYIQTCLKQPTSVLQDPYLPSVFATLRSACILIRKTDAMEKAYPRLMSKVTVSWYHAFCAAVSS